MMQGNQSGLFCHTTFPDNFQLMSSDALLKISTEFRRRS